MKVKITLLTICLTSLLPGSAVIATLPAVTEFAKNNGQYWGTLFLTLPSLIMVPFLLMSPLIIKYFRTSKIVSIGLILYLMSGIGCIISPNIWCLMIARSISGIGAGFVIPYAGALVCEYFSGREREKLISYSGVIMYSGGIILLLLSGYLVDIYWRLAFLIFFVALIPYFLMKKYLHSVHTSDEIAKQKYKLKDTIKFDNLIYITLLLYFMSILFFYCFLINTTYVILDNNMGGARTISIVQSTFMIFCIISNLIIAWIQKKHLRLYVAALFFIIAISFILLSLAYTNIWYIYIGIAIGGLGYGGYASLIINAIAKYTNEANRTNALAFTTAMMYLAQFISPYVSSQLKKIFALNSYNELFFVQAIIILCAAFLALFSYLIKIRNIQKYIKQQK